MRMSDPVVINAQGLSYNADNYFEWIWHIEYEETHPANEKPACRFFFHKGLAWAEMRNAPIGLSPEFVEWLKRRHDGNK